MKRCVVFGGNGFIGSHLVEALLSAGYPVRTFDKLGTSKSRQILFGNQVDWQEGDFTCREDVERAVDGCDVCFHLISTTTPKTSNDAPAFDIQSNLLATLQLLDISKEHKLSKIIFVSSGGTVYGIPQSTPIEETHPTNPVCSYGIVKLAIEKYLHLYKALYDLDYCVLRLSNPFGERQLSTNAQGAVAVFMKRIVSKQPIEIWGDGSVVRDYIYVRDAAEALVKAIDYIGDERVFNIGSGEGHSLNELVREIENVTQVKAERIYLAARKFDVPVSILSISRAKDYLGWSPRHSFREGLTRTESWLRQSLEQ